MRVVGSLIFLITLFIPCQALAVQEHAGGEGLVAHELAHLFFIAVSFYLFISLKKTKKGVPHHYLRKAMLFFLIWNLITFVTHLLRERVNPEFFKSAYLQAENLSHYLWYAGSLTEHFFLVAACFFFMKAILKLKALEEEHETEDPEGLI